MADVMIWSFGCKEKSGGSSEKVHIQTEFYRSILSEICLENNFSMLRKEIWYITVVGAKIEEAISVLIVDYQVIWVLNFDSV